LVFVRNLAIKQCQSILENRHYALFYAVAFALLPFMAWISVAIVALVTLRKGSKQGLDVLLPVLVIHSVPLMFVLPTQSALINAAIAYVPCYIVALCLRRSANWKDVFSVFFVLSLFVSVLMHLINPSFSMHQFGLIKKLLASHDEYTNLLEASLSYRSEVDLSELFFGLQLFSLVMTSLASLALARLVQARLFQPGGFKLEFLAFRGGRIAFFMLISAAVGAYYSQSIALNMLPLVLGYFLITGISLSYSLTLPKWRGKSVMMIVLFMVINPIVLLCSYVVFGALDSLFNFRGFFARFAKESA
jgi:hypothetical protein